MREPRSHVVRTIAYRDRDGNLWLPAPGGKYRSPAYRIVRTLAAIESVYGPLESLDVEDAWDEINGPPEPEPVREARGVVTDSHEVRRARTYDGRDVLEVTFRTDNSGNVVVIPLERATDLAVDLITASNAAYRDMKDEGP